MSDQRLAQIVNSGNASLGASAPKASDVAAKLAAANKPIHGTGATVEAGAKITTTSTGGLQVAADENLHLKTPSGAVAGGFVGVGVGINVVTVQSNVAATAARQPPRECYIRRPATITPSA